MNHNQHHSHRFLTFVKWAVILLLPIIVIFGFVSLKNTKTDSQNEQLLSSCLDSANSSNTKAINAQYGLITTDPYLTSRTSPLLISYLSAQLYAEENCYKQYPLSKYSKDNLSLQKSCVNNASTYYKQFIDVFQSQAILIPTVATNAGQDGAAVMNLQSTSEADCYRYYPT